MPKTIFIIPGFKHSASEDQYKWMKKFFSEQGFIVKATNIKWNNRTMENYVLQFDKYYKEHKTKTNYILGFSFGAMIALISAPQLKPNKLFLCSLSPYFNEDLSSLRLSWRKKMGKQRIAAFQIYKVSGITPLVTMPTTVIYGSVEGKKYPSLKKRCEETADSIKNAKLVIAEKAPHQINYPSYVEAIKEAVG